MTTNQPEQPRVPRWQEQYDLHRAREHEFAGSRHQQEKMIAKMQHEIEEVVKACCPLDFFPQEFVLVDQHQMNTRIARDGFPVRYPHWRFGQAYKSVSTREQYGLQRVYELIINTNPSVGWLLDSNSVQATRLVMVHCYFHNIFFKHNKFFAHTDRKMLTKMERHADRINGHMERYGADKVKRFLDACLSIDNLIDPHSVELRRARHETEDRLRLVGDTGPEFTPAKLPALPHLDPFINPAERLAADIKKQRDEHERRQKMFPVEPERDVMDFVLQHAPLEPWQQDILSIIRDEAYYFAPQMMTKIMNEGWATFWHTKILTEKLLPEYPCEVVDFASMNAGVLHPARQGLNPYRMGYYLFKDIEERWNKGRFGREWESCVDRHARENWDRKLGQGMSEVISAMQSCSDTTFLARYLTPEFIAERNIFGYDRVEDSDTGEYSAYVTYDEFEEVRTRLLAMLSNAGRPVLDVVEANHANRGELVLLHGDGNGILDLKLAEPTLEHLYSMWKRPVHVLSLDDDGDRLRLTVDRNGFSDHDNTKEFTAYFSAKR